jgi:dienelactone hydrolase
LRLGYQSGSAAVNRGGPRARRGFPIVRWTSRWTTFPFAVLPLGCLLAICAAPFGPVRAEPIASASPAAEIPAGAAMRPGETSANVTSPEIVEYFTGDGLRISADYYRPEPLSSEAVVLFHDASGSRSDWRGLCRALAGRGFHVLAPDVWDPSTSKYREAFSGFRGSPKRDEGARAREDVLAAQAFLERTLGGSVSAIVLGGIGRGAALAVLASSQLSRKPAGLLLFEPTPDVSGARSLSILQTLSRPLLVVARAEDPESTPAAWTLYRDSRLDAQFWELSGEDLVPGDLVGRPDICQDLAAWTLETTRKAESTSSRETAGE